MSEDPTDFGAFLEKTVAADPELAVLVDAAEKELAAEDVSPCPFCGACGSDCEVMQDHVSCRVCGATGPYSSYSDDDPEDHEPPSGLELWNTRAI